VKSVEPIIPQGISSTDQWLLQLARLFGRTAKAEAFIRKEHNAIEPQLESIQKVLKGKRVFVGANLTIARSVEELSKDLGFEIIGLQDYLNIKGTGGIEDESFVDMANILHFEQANILRHLKPDLYICRGLTIPYAGITGIPTIPIYDCHTANLGYAGVVSFGWRMVNALKNINFYQKLAQHIQPLYKPDWYDQNAFKYLKPENKNFF